MRIAIIQPNYGDIDNVLPIPEQTVSFEYYTTCPFPLQELSNRMKAKYMKLQHHKFIAADYFIYLDGRVEITSSNFVADIISHLSHSDIVMTKHPQRDTVRQEYQFIQELMQKGNNYLHDRYSLDAILAEDVPGDLPLYACGVFAHKSAYALLDEWWARCIRYSCYDQCWFSLLSQGYNVHPYGYEYVKVNKHR